MSRNAHEYVHPAIRAAAQGLAQANTYGELPATAGPLESTHSAYQRNLRDLQARLRNPALHAYARLVDELATNVNPDVGLYDPKQLRQLSNAERAIVIRGAADVLDPLEVEPAEIAEVYEGTVDARLWLATRIEPLLRQRLFEDVQAEIAKDEEIVRANAADDLADAHGGCR